MFNLTPGLVLPKFLFSPFIYCKVYANEHHSKETGVFVRMKIENVATTTSTVSFKWTVHSTEVRTKSLSMIINE